MLSKNFYQPKDKSKNENNQENHLKFSEIVKSSDQMKLTSKLPAEFYNNASHNLERFLDDLSASNTFSANPDIQSAIINLTFLQNFNGDFDKKLTLLLNSLQLIINNINLLEEFNYLLDDSFITILNNVHNIFLNAKFSQINIYQNLLKEMISCIIEEDISLLIKLLSIIHDVKMMLTSHNVEGYFNFVLPKEQIEWIALKHDAIYASPYIKTRMISKRKLQKAAHNQLGCILPLPIRLPNLGRLNAIICKYHGLCTIINEINHIRDIKNDNLLPSITDSEASYRLKLFSLLQHMVKLSSQLTPSLISLLENNFPHISWTIIAQLKHNWQEILSRVNNKGFDVRFHLDNLNQTILKKISQNSLANLDITWNNLVNELIDVKSLLQKLHDTEYKNPAERFVAEYKELNKFPTVEEVKGNNPPYVFWDRQELNTIKNSCFAFMLELPEWKKVLDGKGLFDSDMHMLVENLINNVEKSKQVQVLQKIKRVEENFLAYQVKRWVKKLPQNDNIMLQFVQKIMQNCPGSRDAWKTHFTNHHYKIQLSKDELSFYKEKISNDNNNQELNQLIDSIFNQLKPSTHQKLYDYLNSQHHADFTVKDGSAPEKAIELIKFCLKAIDQLNHNAGRKLANPELAEYIEKKTTLIHHLDKNANINFSALVYALNALIILVNKLAYEDIQKITQTKQFEQSMGALSRLLAKLESVYEVKFHIEGTSSQDLKSILPIKLLDAISHHLEYQYNTLTIAAI